MNTLYTGPEITSAPVYAANYTYLWCVLLYSLGCPLLYPLAAVFYTTQYWYYKSLSVKYLRRASQFPDQLPIGASDNIKIGLFMHIIMSYSLLSDDGLLPGPRTVLTYDLASPGAQAERLLDFLFAS